MKQRATPVEIEARALSIPVVLPLVGQNWRYDLLIWSVPGLVAKPIIDVVVVVSDVGNERSYATGLEDAGDVLRVGEPGHRLFRTPAKDVHIHVSGSGAAAVVDAFSGRAQTAQLALIDAAVGAVWAPGGKPRVVFGFTITDGKIVAIDLQSGPQRVRGLDVTILGNVVESADS